MSIPFSEIPVASTWNCHGRMEAMVTTFVPLLSKLGTMPVPDYAPLWSYPGTCLITTASPANCQHMNTPESWPILLGLSFSGYSGTASCHGGMGRILPACGHPCWSWANIQMYNTPLVTQSSSEHLSSPLPPLQYLFQFCYPKIMQLVLWLQG